VHENDDRTGGTFTRVLRSAVRPVDVAGILAVPLALLGAFALPESTRHALAFSYSDPTLWTAFTANYVHLGTDHLLANVVSYVVVVPLVYLLSVLAGRRRRFLVAFTTFLVALPAALSILNLAISRPGATVGFSGINMAFVGFLPLALSGFLAAHFDVDAELDLAGGLFFAGLALVAVLSVRSPVTYGVAAAAALAAVVFFGSVVDLQERTRPDVRAAVQAGGYFELAAAAFVLFAALQLLAFPVDPVVDDGVVNLYVHLLGYAIGFIATYATIHVAGRLPAGAAVLGE
jgi:hypothetical protein